jgi:hypothetical protein
MKARLSFAVVLTLALLLNLVAVNAATAQREAQPDVRPPIVQPQALDACGLCDLFYNVSVTLCRAFFPETTIEGIVAGATCEDVALFEREDCRDRYCPD